MQEKQEQEIVSLKISEITLGAQQAILRTKALGLCYSAVEYCAPVWTRSSHIEKVNIKLRETIRIISGCLKSTHIEWLPFIA